MTKSAFLPEQQKEGYLGYYPTTKEEFRELPLPMRCATAYPCSGEYITGVIFEARFEDYGIQGQVEIHPANVFKALFCKHGEGILLYSVCAVRWASGETSFAKWWQDVRTGAFQISTITGTPLLRQGGFHGHIPANCKYNEELGKWELHSAPHTFF